MATERTPNLNLAVPSDASPEARANLYTLDALGAATKVDSHGNLLLRSKHDIRILPEDATVGGSEDGSGEVFVGDPDNLANVTLYGTLAFRGAIRLLDTAAGGTRFLTLQYKSDASGSTDAAADRVLILDLEGADRRLILSGDLTTTGGAVTLASSGPSAVSLPSSGTLATLSGNEVLSNKAIDAATNTITGLTNANVASAAAISGTKISPDFGSQTVATAGRLRLSGPSFYSELRAAQSGQVGNILWTLPPADGSPNQALSTDGAGNLSWVSISVASYAANRAIQSGPTGALEASSVTSTELGYLAGVTSPLQAQLSARGRSLSATWLTADGTSKSISHGFSTRKVTVELLDVSNDYATIEAGSVTRPDNNTVVLTSSEAPASSWLVLLTEVLN